MQNELNENEKRTGATSISLAEAPEESSDTHVRTRKVSLVGTKTPRALRVGGVLMALGGILMIWGTFRNFLFNEDVSQRLIGSESSSLWSIQDRFAETWPIYAIVVLGVTAIVFGILLAWDKFRNHTAGISMSLGSILIGILVTWLSLRLMSGVPFSIDQSAIDTSIPEDRLGRFEGEIEMKWYESMKNGESSLNEIFTTFKEMATRRERIDGGFGEAVWCFFGGSLAAILGGWRAFSGWRQR